MTPNEEPTMPPYDPTPTPAPSGEHPTPHRGRRVGVLLVSGALLVGAMTVGGIAVAERAHQGGTATAQSGTAATRQWQRGYAQGYGQGQVQGGYSGGQDLGGQDLGGQGLGGQSLGGQTQQGLQGQASSDQTTSDATATQASGLVFITSSLGDGEARGTGIVLSANGEVVTNHHVVAGATKIEVTVAATGKSYTATYVGGDATKDVAVLRLEGASGLSTADVDTSSVSVGDTITAVGDANGDRGTLTAAAGTVTGTDKSITVSDDDGTKHRLTGLVQLDADIVSGDSGGAVRTSDGDVAAMNVAASSGSAEVTGYAIAMSTVMSVVDAIDSNRASSEITLGSSGYLGVGISEQQTTGAVVVEVTDDGAAHDAGIVAGDTVTSFGGTAVTTGSQLSKLVAADDPGDRVAVTWTTTSGSTRTATVTLGSVVG